MLKLIVKGGLGNQMFQYAAAYALSQQIQTDLLIDLSFIKNRLPIPGFTYREYELDLFKIKNKTTTFFNNNLLDTYLAYPIEAVLARLGLIQYFSDSNPYKFEPHFLEVQDGAYIEGYFNNPRYFETYEQDIKQIFNLDLFFDKKFADIETKINSSDSVSINIRRGDYLNAKHKDVFIHLTEEYYLKAIELIRKKIKKPHFYIFSYDDPAWFKKALKLEDNEFTYMDKSYVGEQFKTYLRLISLCKHNIISNSTFAFWGAYLNKNKNKQVILPKKWAYNSVDFDAPKDWHSI